MVFVIILIVVSALSWFFVVDGRARKKLVRGHWSVFGWSPFKITDQYRELDETLTLVSLLISGVLSTTILVFLIIVNIAELFK